MIKQRNYINRAFVPLVSIAHYLKLRDNRFPRMPGFSSFSGFLCFLDLEDTVDCEDFHFNLVWKRWINSGQLRTTYLNWTFISPALSNSVRLWWRLQDSPQDTWLPAVSNLIQLHAQPAQDYSMRNRLFDQVLLMFTSTLDSSQLFYLPCRLDQGSLICHRIALVSFVFAPGNSNLDHHDILHQPSRRLP